MSDAPRPGPTSDGPPWWAGAVVYQVYPRSFCDTTGDGVGDLDGIRRHLDHLTWLGVDALWLSPIYPSPMADHGYDVADYEDVDPLFGDIDRLDHLVAEAHERGLRVLLDWVPNHTSDQHPWFLASRSSRDDPKRDWYLWADGTPGSPPTPWQAVFPPGPSWTYDATTAAWYHHAFTPHQPDLNWSNPAVSAAMHDTLRFWLDRGIDGFRMDVVHMIGKDPARLAPGFDGPIDAERTHDAVRGIRRVLDEYPGDRVAVGEVYVLDVEEVAGYLADDELHLAFNFVPLFTPWAAAPWRAHLAAAADATDRRRAWPTWALSNHDIPRTRTRLGSDAATRAAAVLLLGLRGTAFLYAGEELGLEDAVVPPGRAVDPAGFRDGCRAPLPWDGPPTHGWATASPWLPWPPRADTHNVAAQRHDPTSGLHLYRRLLELRRSSPALRHGDFCLLPPGTAGEPDAVVAWARRAGGDTRVVAVNFSAEPRPFVVRLPDGDAGAPAWRIQVASDRVGEGDLFPDALGPDQAIVLAPA